MSIQYQVRSGALTGFVPLLATLGGDADRVTAGIEQRQRADSGSPANEAVPCLLGSSAQRRHASQTGNDNSGAHVEVLSGCPHNQSTGLALRRDAQFEK